MHLSQRAYGLVILTGVLAIVGIWSVDPTLSGWWRVPAVMLLAGVALEGHVARRLPLSVDIDTAARAYLGREQPASYVIRNDSGRSVTLEFLAAVPQAVEPSEARVLCATTAPRTRGSVPFVLTPVRLGSHKWPALPARVRGALGLAWWTRRLQPSMRLVVVPDLSRLEAGRPRGFVGGARPRRQAGAGADLHQLRAYVRGDPPARIDWKALARSGRLITRELAQDQHLEVLIAIDAGRFSRVRAGRLERFGLYANIAARLAERVVDNDDRIGLLVFADRTVRQCGLGRGRAAVQHLRAALADCVPRASEFDALGAAVRIRELLTHRSLIVMLTDVDDASIAAEVSQAVRLLSPPHVLVMAGVINREITRLATAPAIGWQDPWVALAAQEHGLRADSQRRRLRRLGATVVATDDDALEGAVLIEYERLRRARRV